MKVCFLDCDGVLNSCNWFHSEIYQKIKSKPTPENWAQTLSLTDEVSRFLFCEIFGERRLDLKAVKFLQEILEKTGCNVVISSTWRTIFRLEEIIRMLISAGLSEEYGDRFISMTPRLGHERGLEIQAWMEAAQVKPQDVCIVDDDGDQVHLIPRLVLINGNEGLGKDSCEKVIQMLR